MKINCEEVRLPSIIGVLELFGQSKRVFILALLATIVEMVHIKTVSGNRAY
jgi:hypothetical protein